MKVGNQRVDALGVGLGFGVGAARHGVQVDLCADVAGAGGHDDADVAVGGLHAQRGAEDAEQVEVG